MPIKINMILSLLIIHQNKNLKHIRKRDKWSKKKDSTFSHKTLFKLQTNPKMNNLKLSIQPKEIVEERLLLVEIVDIFEKMNQVFF